MKRLDGQAAIEIIANADWRMEFDVYDEGNVSVFLDDYGEPVAALRWADKDTTGISFFETRYQGSGIGGAIVEQLKVEIPGLHVSGDIDNAGCARFWTRHGFDCDGVELSNGKVWHA